jgi:hypothetical protein
MRAPEVLVQEGFQHKELLPGHALLHEGAREKVGEGTVSAREHDHELRRTGARAAVATAVPAASPLWEFARFFNGCS